MPLDDPEAWAEAGLLIADALPDLDEEAFTMEQAAMYIRCAYAVGYVQALDAKDPLSEKDARVAAARLRLAVPEDA